MERLDARHLRGPSDDLIFIVELAGRSMHCVEKHPGKRFRVFVTVGAYQNIHHEGPHCAPQNDCPRSPQPTIRLRGSKQFLCAEDLSAATA